MAIYRGFTHSKWIFHSYVNLPEGIPHLPGEGLVILTTAQLLPSLAAIVVSGAGHHIAVSPAPVAVGHWTRYRQLGARLVG